MGRSYDVCTRCGRSDAILSFVGGQWWCRNCLFEETFDLAPAVNYILLHIQEYGDRYPDGVDWLWKWLRGEASFSLDYLEDYAEWVMTNPSIYSLENIREVIRRM